MMEKQSETAIEVTNISKLFHVNEAGKSIDFTALQDVSFALKKGEIMGIVGSNGSGKSTLLKILGEVIKPTSGSAKVYGTISSILDIGDNFHPDLTGRENVNLQLRLQNLPKKEFAVYHSRIKEFSEIVDFYDRPVKTYSDGMFLRLAFSVAIQLSADILLLDEVLSVGDEGFQQKCREELAKLALEGKSILFVSHSHAEVRELATCCLWLHKGQVRKMGNTADILGEYFLMHKDNLDNKKKIVDVNPFLTVNEAGISIEWPEEKSPGNDVMSIRHISIFSANNGKKLYNTSPICFKFIIEKKRKGIRIAPFFFLQDMFHQPVMVAHFLNNTQGNVFDLQTKDETGLIEMNCLLPANFLMPGTYYFALRFGMEQHEWNPLSEEAFRFSETLSFTILSEPSFIDLVGDLDKGSVRPVLEWNMMKTKEG